LSAALKQTLFRPSIVIPVYNHRDAVAHVVMRLEPFQIPCFLVDDGSTDGSSEVLESLAEKFDWLRLVPRKSNGGKGIAVADGVRAALEAGYTHVLQIDADGQHDVSSIPEFLKIGLEHPETVVLGCPMFDADAPRIRVWGRQISNFLVRLESLRFLSKNAPKDVLCGYRLYPVALYRELVLAVGEQSRGMDFDIDIVVRLCWAGAEFANLNTRVSYPEDGISHFRYLRDNLKLSALHLRLIFQGLLRAPKILFSRRRLTEKYSSQHGWSRLPERGNNFWVNFLFFYCRTFGRTLSNFLLRPVILYFILTGGHAKKASEKYLRRVLNIPEGKRVPFVSIYRHFLNFGLCLIDKVSVWTDVFDYKDFRWHGRDALRADLGKGRGVIMLGAHFGNIEVGRAFAEDASPLRINALMYTGHAARYHEFLQHHRADSHLRVIGMNSASPTLVMQLREAIAAGECVGMLADRITPGSPDKSVEASFFGERALFPAGPFILGSLLDAPVYLVFSVRADDGSYDIYFEKFAESLLLPRETREQSLRAHVEKYAAQLERFCRQAPYQWFNFYDFWSAGKVTKTL